MYNRDKFHRYSIFGCQVNNFQSFSYRFSIHEITLFGGRGFQVLTTLNIVQFCRNIHQKQYLSRKKQFFNNLARICILTQTGCTQTLQLQCIFRANLPPEKQNILLRNKVFGKTTSLGLLSNVNSQNCCKIKPKNSFFWAKNGPKLPPGIGSKTQQKFSHNPQHLHFSTVSTY